MLLTPSLRASQSRIQPKRLQIISLRLPRLALCCQRLAQIEEGVGIVGGKAKSLPILANSLGKTSLASVYRPQIIVEKGAVGLNPDCLLVSFDCLAVVAGGRKS